MSDDKVLYRIEENIAIITLNRPQQRDARFLPQRHRIFYTQQNGLPLPARSLKRTYDFQLIA